MEFLKEFLGNDLYSQVEAKLKNNDKVKLVNLASGEYISKGKFNNLEQAKKELENTIIQRDKDLKALKGAAKGNEDLQKQFDDLQVKYDTESKAYETKIKDTQMSAALAFKALVGRVNIGGAKATATLSKDVTVVAVHTGTLGNKISVIVQAKDGKFNVLTVVKDKRNTLKVWMKMLTKRRLLHTLTCY